MKLTKKLISHIHSIFDRGSDPFLALRMKYAGTMTWEVSDERLITTISGGVGSPINVDLSLHTISSLAAYISTRPGYSVQHQETVVSKLKATVLIDATGNQSDTNGDYLFGYTSLLWWYLEAMALELTTMSAQIKEMLKQMSIVISKEYRYNNWANDQGNFIFRTELILPIIGASDEWLDEHGSYYKVPRNIGETDALYGPRIISEVLRPRGNNKAIELAIQSATGVIATVNDVGVLSYPGGDCAGLFDILYESGSVLEDPEEFKIRVIEVVNSMRNAGTFLRELRLYLIYDGTHKYDGTVRYNATPL